MCETGEMGVTGQQQLVGARVLSFFFILVILKRWAFASWTSFVAGVRSRDTGGHEEMKMGGDKPATLGARRKHRVVAVNGVAAQHQYQRPDACRTGV